MQSNVCKYYAHVRVPSRSMSKINERIKEERVRLGLSQATFAQKAGIHRNTQIKYESGERYPDSEYIDSIGNIGVDVFYIFRGVKSEDRDMHEVAQIEFREGIYAALGLSHQEIASHLLEMMQLATKEVDEGGAWDTEAWVNKRDKFISSVLSGHHVTGKALPLQDVVDVNLLSGVIAGLEAALEKLGGELSPEKKARAVVMLYRAFKASGKVDRKMIEETIALASS